MLHGGDNVGMSLGKILQRQYSQVPDMLPGHNKVPQAGKIAICLNVVMFCMYKQTF